MCALGGKRTGFKQMQLFLDCLNACDGGNGGDESDDGGSDGWRGERVRESFLRVKERKKRIFNGKKREQAREDHSKTTR